MNFIEWTLFYFGKPDKTVRRQQGVIDKLVLRMRRQAARITELEALYAGTVESKNHKILQEKYVRCRSSLQYLRNEEEDESLLPKLSDLKGMLAFSERCPDCPLTLEHDKEETK